MNLSKSNLFARYYNWIYGNLPNDLCSFFWGSLFAIVLFPIYIPGRISNSTGESRFWPGVVVWAIYIVLVTSGISMYSSWLGYKEIPDGFIASLPGYMIYLVMPLISATVISVSGLAVCGVVILIIKYDETPKTITVVENAKDFIGAVRGKYCTKIKWK